MEKPDLYSPDETLWLRAFFAQLREDLAPDNMVSVPFVFRNVDHEFRWWPGAKTPPAGALLGPAGQRLEDMLLDAFKLKVNPAGPCTVRGHLILDLYAESIELTGEKEVLVRQALHVDVLLHPLTDLQFTRGVPPIGYL
jgi:hypothetical protein